jgi:3-methyl-2-oxobutanoate hydroxymethyltransferase
MAETGCAAVKLEGGVAMADTIAFLTKRGIPVMAHVGLTPQAVNALGGYGARGKSQEEYARIVEDAEAVAKAGAFSLVIEGVVEDLARQITDSVSIPTIGIGASAACDGQVLVVDDMLGMFERTPRFVKRFGTLAEDIGKAAGAYAAAVKDRSFPEDAQLYGVKK